MAKQGKREDPTVVPFNDDAPDKPTELTKRSWWGVLKRTVKEFNQDNLTDWAAALTYYGILSIFPGILVLLSVSDMLLTPTTQGSVIDSVKELVPASIAEPLGGAIEQLSRNNTGAGIFAIVGLAGALWTSSGYVSAFMRAANAIYDVPEGRPMWKTLPIRLGVTLVVGTLIAIAALSIVFTGKLAEEAGSWIGLGRQAVQVWDIAKWPVLLLIVTLVLAIMYWAAPNARHGGFRWISPGGAVAVVTWIVASAGFAIYVSNFGSYDKTYGTLGGIIVFLIWLWISNIAILFGAEFDAELERARAIEGGHPASEEPYIALRDSSKVKPETAGGLS